MGRYLLDTHTAIWFFEDNPALSGTAKNIILTIYETLPLLHRDPFDRLLIATAIPENMTLITDDRNIALYDVSQIW